MLAPPALARGPRRAGASGRANNPAADAKPEGMR
jgi:hypothetical protein